MRFVIIGLAIGLCACGAPEGPRSLPARSAPLASTVDRPAAAPAPEPPPPPPPATTPESCRRVAVSCSQMMSTNDPWPDVAWVTQNDGEGFAYRMRHGRRVLHRRLSPLRAPLASPSILGVTAAIYLEQETEEGLEVFRVADGEATSIFEGPVDWAHSHPNANPRIVWAYRDEGRELVWYRPLSNEPTRRVVVERTGCARAGLFLEAGDEYHPPSEVALYVDAPESGAAVLHDPLGSDPPRRIEVPPERAELPICPAFSSVATLRVPVGLDASNELRLFGGQTPSDEWVVQSLEDARAVATLELREEGACVRELWLTLPNARAYLNMGDGRLGGWLFDRERWWSFSCTAPRPSDPAGADVSAARP